MVISNYYFQNNRYHIGGIKKVFLQQFEDNVLYHIDDNGLPICEGIEGTLSAITIANASLTQNSQFDRNRFAFSYNLQFSFLESFDNLHTDFLEDIRKNKYRAFIQTNEGDYFLVNAEYPFTATYDYSWNTHLCTVNLQSVNNIPTMLCTAFTEQITSVVGDDCGYITNDIPQFEIIETDNVLIGDDNGVITSVTTVGSSTWKNVEPLRDSFSFTHSFDGYNFQDEVQFTIELSDYLSTWHYNLLEFVKNTYAVRFKTNKGHTLISNELFPSFELSTEESVNRIRITLRNRSYRSLQRSTVQNDNVNDDKRSAGASKSRNRIPASTVEISGLTFPTMECISSTMAKRILFPQININGDETGKYYVLEGYEDYFSPISDIIIGSISGGTNESMYVATPACADYGCLFTANLSSRNYMINSSTAFFSIISSCGWEIISKDECLTFSQMSGGTNELALVDVASSCEFGKSSHFTIKVGDDEYEYEYIRVNTTSCFIQDSERYITAQAQRLTFQMNVTDVEILEILRNNNPTTALTVSINGSTLSVSVPEYTDFRGTAIQWQIRLQSAIGGYCEVQINQDHPWMIDKLEPNMYECYEGDKFRVYQGYSGYTRDTVTIPTGIYTFDPDSRPIERDSPDCNTETITKWVDSDDYYCEPKPDHDYVKWSASTETMCSGTTKYSVEYQMVSDDGETWSATSNSRIGELIETNSPDCGYCPRQTEWRDSTDTADTICDGYTLKHIAYQWESMDCGETWQRTPITGYGTTIEEQSAQCGYEPTPSGEPITRWVDTTNTICDNGNLYYIAEQQISYDSGTTWASTGKIRQGTLIEADSNQCSQESGDTTTMYRWRNSLDTICDGDDLYRVQDEYMSTDGMLWTPTGRQRIGTIIEEDSANCVDGEYEGSLYKWEEGTDTICFGTDLYATEEQYVSNDSGTTWSKTGNIRVGAFIESDSNECKHDESSGSTITMYKWEDSATATICDANDLYKVQEEYKSTDGGSTWAKTGNQRKGDLIERNSASCSDEEVINGWFDSDDYYCEEAPEHPYAKWSASTETMCSGTTKYSVEYQMVSDDGETWSATTNSRIGSIIETKSIDCGYGLIQYKWEEGDGTICSDGDLYSIEEQYQTTDGGITWAKTGNVRVGAFIESDSDQCGEEGSGTTMYKWEDSTESTICIGDDLYAISYRYVSYDNGTSWTRTGESRIGRLIETNSRRCSDIESGDTIYKWEDSTDTMCDGTSLYYVSYEYQSTDNGVTWTRTGEYEAGTLIALNSPQCTTIPIYKWESNGDTMCENGDLYEIEERWVSYDNGVTWSLVGMARRQLVEMDSQECVGCIYETRWISSTDTADTVCQGTSLYLKAYEWWSDDCWETSARTDNMEYRVGDLVEKDSYECGYRGYRWVYIDDYCDGSLPSGTTTGDTEPIDIYKWEYDGSTTCDGYDLYYVEFEWVSYDNGVTWIKTGKTRLGELIEQDSTECGYVPPSTSGDYLTFIALDSGTFKFTGSMSANNTTNRISYSTDSGSTWSNPSSSITVNVNSGDVVMWKGETHPYTYIGIGSFSGTASFDIQGNVLSLLHGDNFIDIPRLSGYKYAFANLFNRAKCVNANKLALIATTLTDSCYDSMFYNCTSLTTAPELPATTLASMCYATMFYGCTSLVTATELPATTLANGCYMSMFEGCTSLTTAPKLLATTLVDYCYNYMFNGCSLLNYIKMMATNISATQCLSNWVRNVAASGTFVKDANMTTLPTGDSGIPQGWTVQNA